MTTPPFDPQPCCGDGGGTASEVTIVGPDPLNVNVTNQLTEPVDVNLVSPDPVNVVVTNQLTEPLDVTVTNQLTEPLDVNVISPDPLNVTVTNQLAEPFDVNVISSVPVDVTVTSGGSTTAAATLTNAVSGDGTTVDFEAARSNVTLFIQPNGTVTSGVVSLEASQDGVNWVKVASSAVLATGVNQYVSLTGGAFRWFRGVVSEAVAGGGSVTATLMHA